MAKTKALGRLKSRIDGIELSTPQNRPSIYKVHKHLRDLNKNAYEPDIVAIGPYHRGKDNLQMMEDHKWRYLKSLLLRKSDVKIESYVSAVEKREQEARSCYAESVSLNRDKFIEMLVLDGCFIVELILKCSFGDSTNNDPIFQTLWISTSLQRDLMLFENQIPFFILRDFFDLIGGPHGLNFKLTDSVLVFLDGLHPEAYERNSRESKSEEVNHILDLLHINWSHSDDNGTANLESNTAGAVERNRETKNSRSQDVKKRILDLLHINWCHSDDDGTANLESNTARNRGTKNSCSQDVKKRILDLLHCNWSHSSNDTASYRESLPLIPSASELRDYNVKFQMKKSSNLFGVEFVKGTMSMAPLRIDDHTECVFRNLIAYEQYFPNARQTPFTNYHMLLDCLINSLSDVEILCRRKIIENWLGDNEAVVRIVNGIGDCVVMRNLSPYANTFYDINTHCQKRRNRAIAKLKRDYFNSPWAYISFFAALVLLLLTLAQTVFAAIQLP